MNKSLGMLYWISSGETIVKEEIIIKIVFALFLM